MTAKKFTFTRDNGEDVTAEITNFANIFGLERAAPGRCSILLVFGLWGGFKSGSLNPAKVVNEIRVLEGIGSPSRLKAPVEFKHPPLKGLWHKHYLPDGIRSMAWNIQKGLNKYGLPLFKQRIADAEAAGVERHVSFEDIPSLVDDAVNRNWARLAGAAALNGKRKIPRRDRTDNANRLKRDEDLAILLR
jgi:hypothetical protein